jgi:hypothetical protein
MRASKTSRATPTLINPTMEAPSTDLFTSGYLTRYVTPLPYATKAQGTPHTIKRTSNKDIDIKLTGGDVSKKDSPNQRMKKVQSALNFHSKSSKDSVKLVFSKLKNDKKQLTIDPAILHGEVISQMAK